MKPQDVGIDGTELVLGKHSGRHAFKHHLSKMGVILSKEEQIQAYDRFIKLADKKKYIYQGER